MCQIFVIQVSFQSYKRLEPDYHVYLIMILFNLSSQGSESFEPFSHETSKISEMKFCLSLIAKM